ncbi:MAG: T9SS type A sorting domain-containing protein [Flavobacteriales bacterium]
MRNFFLLFVLLLSLSSKAQIDIDHTGSDPYYVFIDFTQSVAQSFTPTVSGRLTQIDLDLEADYCVDNPVLSIHFDLLQGSGTGGQLLDSLTYFWSIPISRAMHGIAFPNMPQVCAGNVYTIVATIPNQPFCDIGASTYPTVKWFSTNTDSYPNGNLFSNGTPILTEDLYFRTFYYDAFSVSFALTPSTCPGMNDGSITSTPSGGIPPYTYSWSPSGGNLQNPHNLAAGIYSVIVTDSSGCTFTENNLEVINVNSPISINFITVNHPTCFGSSNGQITTSVTGGIPPYSYLWNGTISSQDLSNISQGYYELQVTDSSGCVETNGQSLIDPSEIVINFSGTSPNCPGGTNGSITTSITGGVPPYSYQWTPGMQTTSGISGISAGTYSLTVIDFNGCTKIDSHQLIDGSYYIETGAMTVQPETCLQSNGSITGVYAVTSNGPVNYVWSAPNTNNNLFNVPGGNYLLTATDNAGCVDTVTINVPSLGFALSMNHSSTPASCTGICDGSATVSANGGTPPYSFVWSNGQTGSVATGLCANTHTVTVSDVNGCSRSTNIGIGQPGPFNVAPTYTEATCGASDGSISLSVVAGGTPPHTFSWTTGVSGSSITGVPAGSYGVTITDANNCQNYRVFSLNSASGPSISTVLTNPTCFGSSDGSIDQTITGGTAPISILWSTGHTVPDLNAIPEGVYDVEISDASGCVIYKTYELFAPPAIEIFPSLTNPSCGVPNGGITLNASGGTSPYTYVWSANAGGAVTPAVSPLSAGIYSVTITDVNGCTLSQSIGLSNDNGPTISTDALIQPSCQNDDGAIFITASGVPGPFNYNWSGLPYPQNIQADQTDLAPGIYNLSVFAPGGCQSHMTYSLTVNNSNAQEICLITVDSITNKNVVVWEKTDGLGIAEFELFRETSVPGVFLKIATIPYNDLSSFNDNVASTSSHAWKYKLVTIDSCGISSSTVASHKTIHMNAELISGGTEVELTWDNYIGFSYSDVNVLRNHNGTGWVVIATLPSTQFTYTDNNLPTNGILEYSVEAIPTSPCVASRAINHNTTRSNKGSVAAPVGISENEKLQHLKIFPNPTSGIFRIEGVYSTEENIIIEVFDMTGRCVYSNSIVTANQSIQLNLSTYENGLYSIRISTVSASTTKSLVIQK